jgi:hypothetical protein
VNRLCFRILFLFVACATCFGQTSYKGLTPGKSTRADGERVFGQPKKMLSPTLAEFEGGAEVNKIYMQYRDTSSAAIVERIEFVCDYPGRAEGRPDGCSDLWLRLGPNAGAAASGRVYADLLEKTNSDIFKTTRYHGLPSLIVRTWSRKGDETIQSRLGLYSTDLFYSVVPKNCTGTFLGEWETNRGRLILTDIPGGLGSDSEPDTRGTYSANNGSVTGRVGDTSTFTGEWKDATGSGSFNLKINPGSAFEVTWPDPKKVFTGTWERTTGRGPKKGTWAGRCVDTKVAANPDTLVVW